ncbi:MAG: hypothetical protein NUV73_00145 [Candidatus Daviesbacteria bacterium]|nr:hypothetical protein [Candidatus Daviesbacteria bacterium]
MTPLELATYVRYKTRTNSTTLPDAEILSYLGVRLDAIIEKSLDADEDEMVVPSNATLVASQRQYSLPLTILSRIKYIEAMLDGTNWIHLDEMELSQYKRGTDETTITTYFQNIEGEAYYLRYWNSIFILSGTIVDVTDGIKLWLKTYPWTPNDLSSDTEMNVDHSATEHGIPRPLHKLLAKGIVIEWKESKDKPIPLTQSELMWDKQVQDAIYTMKHGNLDKEIIGSIPSAQSRGDDGSNY